MFDPTLEKLAGLQPLLANLATDFINDLRNAGIPMMIISGRRSSDLNAQVGGAAHSLHLSGSAFDVQVLGYTRDELPDWWWEAVGNYGETTYGLRWGGRFATPDVNHFDLGNFGFFSNLA